MKHIKATKYVPNIDMDFLVVQGTTSNIQDMNPYHFAQFVAKE